MDRTNYIEFFRRGGTFVVSSVPSVKTSGFLVSYSFLEFTCTVPHHNFPLNMQTTFTVDI
jgi:hypothetical protein